jgi:hypothetical protein
MNSKSGSLAACILTTWNNEGMHGFYRGFMWNWARIGPHSIVTFMAYEQLRLLVGMKPV